MLSAARIRRPAGVIRNAAHAAGEVDDLAIVAGAQSRQQLPREAQRTHGIDLEEVFHLGEVELGERPRADADAGVVDQHVDSLAGQLGDETFHTARVRHIQWAHIDLESTQLIGCFRSARGGDDTLAAGS